MAANLSYIPAPKVNTPAILIMGPSGSGKTDSLMTLLEAGLKLFVLSTEGNGIEILLDSARRRLKGKEHLFQNLHWKHIVPTVVDFKTMAQKAKLSNSMGIGGLQQLEQGLERNKYPQFMNILRSCQDLTCDRTGEAFGNLADLDDTWAFCCDSLTGINTMVCQHVKGHRPTMTQPEFGVAQEHIRDIITAFTSLRCISVVTAHIEKETNLITGAEKIMASTVGKKLAPDLPIPFSEVIRSRCQKGEFLWSTLDDTAEVKSRALPKSNKLKADFLPIIEAYRRRKEEAEAMGTIEEVKQPAPAA